MSNFEAFVGWRYLRSKRKDVFVSLIEARDRAQQPQQEVKG